MRAIAAVVFCGGYVVMWLGWAIVHFGAKQTEPQTRRAILKRTFAGRRKNAALVIALRDN